MRTLIGAVMVMGRVIGGDVAVGGDPGNLFKPFEVVFIAGAACGALLLFNRQALLSATGQAAPHC